MEFEYTGILMQTDHAAPQPQATGPADMPALAITATFTAEALEPALAFWLSELDWECAVRFAPYNQVFQQLLDPAGLFARNRHGVNVALVRWEDWARFDHEPSLALLEANVRHFIGALRSAAATLPAPLLVAICPASPAFLSEPGRAAFLDRMEELLRAAVWGLPAVYLVAPGELAALYPVPEPHDPHGDELGHIPYTPVFFAALATLLVRKVHALRTPPYKVIALDCDETLWAGICGEDGPEGVVIDPPRRALQEFMLARRREGMLLSLVSKNNEEDVVETFRVHPEMPLSLDDFVARRINWESKSANLAALAEDLDLGLDSMILVDDNPKECTEVEAGCPEVLALALPPDPADIPAFLRHVWAFDRLRVTREDRERTALYAQQVERHRLERQATSLEEFLARLELVIRIAPAAPADLPRIAQLTARTNQMNTTTVRHTEAGLQQAFAAGAECLAVHVSDRFGSYGLTGVAIFRAAPAALVVDSFLLSCRALGRGVEHAMLAALGEAALARAIPRVDLPFVPTARNRPALLFLESAGAAFREPGGEGFLFCFPAPAAAAVRYRPGASRPRADAAAPKRASAPAARAAVDYARIATGLREPARVLQLSRPLPQPEAAPRDDAALPRTLLEGRLAGIWKELLNLPSIGIHDNFFDLGGHSLLAVQLLSRVRQACGVDLSLEVVYSGEFTIAELAKAVELKELEQSGGEEYAALVEELENLSDEEVRALLAEAERGGRGTG